MRFLPFRIFRRRRRRGYPADVVSKDVLGQEAVELKIPDLAVAFSVHMSRYAGSMVTVFTAGGGMAGAGFTGILLNTNNVYIRLLVSSGPAPFADFLSYCRLSPDSLSRTQGWVAYPKATLGSLGAIALIPVGKVAAFVHK